MTRPQKTTILILAGTAGLATGLWFLPRGSVQQKAAMSDSAKASGQMAAAEEDGAHAGAEADTTADMHLATISAEDETTLAGFRRELVNSPKARKMHLTDSLARRYTRLGRFDSALKYREVALGLERSEQTLFAAGEAAYTAYSVSSQPKRQAALAAKAQDYYGQVLERAPKRLDAKTHLALTYVSGPTPMKGIGLLREVLAADPNNEEATYQLGILSLQSSQFDKAATRFEQILARNPDNTRARFYLGLAYKELGKPDKARQELERVRDTDPDPAVQATVRDYLAELNTR